MKGLIGIVFAILLLVPACNRDNTGTTRAESEQEATATANMQRQRDGYVNTVAAKLDEFDKKLDGLESRAAQMTGTNKQNFDKEIDRLRGQRKAVARKLDDLKKVKVDSWVAMKGEVDSAWLELERSYEKLSAELERTSTTTSQSPVKTY